MRKLVTVRRLLEDAEEQGLNPDELYVDPEDVVEAIEEAEEAEEEE